MIFFYALSRYWLFYFIYFISLLNIARSNCVKVKLKHAQNTDDDYEVKCTKIDNVRDLNSNLGNLTNISQLTLSNNNISTLYPQSFSLSKLTKLDLSRNSISHIEKGAFLGLDNLKLLNLANNKLKTLSKGIFEGLTSLETLKLNQNFIATIPYGTFNDLPALNKLNIVGNPLVCDCNLLWLLQKPSMKLTQGSKCVDPALYRGVAIEKAYKSSVNVCANDFNVLSLIPHESQIVIQNDPFHIRCKVSEFAISNDSVKNPLFWTFNDVHTIVESNEHIRIAYPFVEDTKLLYSDFFIEKTSDVHAGEWICNFRSKHVNQSIGVKIIVLSEKTNYCESLVTKDNKGTYAWPRTPAFTTVILPCKHAEDIENSTRANFASYSCAGDGKWIDHNTTNCPYISSVTKILYQFSKMNLTNHKESLIESAKRLRNFTNDNLVKMNDPTDLSYILSTIENYLVYLPSENELGPLLMEIIGAALKIPPVLLHEAQRQFEVCSRFLKSIETISRYTPSFEYQNTYFSLKKFHISPETFDGLTCTLFKQNGSFLSNCTVSNGTNKNTNLEISVQIPSHLLYSSDMEPIQPPSMQILMIGTFNDNGLFLEKINNTRYSIVPPVIAANLVGVKSSKLDDPIYVILKNYYPGLNPQLAWWDTGAGMWLKDGCSSVRTSIHTNHLIFQCQRTGYFALLTDRVNVSVISDNREIKLKSSTFEILPFFIYIGTFVCIACLLLLTVVYIVFYGRIETSRTVKHAKINMWLSTSSFCIIFCMGIWRTDNQTGCQIIGLSIHYFALSTFFWMAVIIKKLYRCVQKNHASTRSDDVVATGEEIIVRKRILGIYLVGWGISLILCGISGAVNLQGYAGDRYCFLKPGPSLSTVLIPASLILLYLSIMCTLVNCATGSADSNPQLSVGTQAIDLELLDNVGGRVSVNQEHSTSVASVTSPPSSQAEDLHHSPRGQLKVFVIFLTLYLTLLISAAGSIVLLPATTNIVALKLSYSNSIPEDNNRRHYFGVVYLIASVCISILEFATYYVRRTDVRIAVCDMRIEKKRLENSTGTTTVVPATARLITNNSSNGESKNELLLRAGNIADDYIKSSTVDNRLEKRRYQREFLNDNNIIDGNNHRHRKNIIPSSCFYNPHQSSAAKKFFRRQRRKRNTLYARRCRSGGSSPVSIATGYYRHPADDNIIGKTFDSVVKSKLLSKVEQQLPQQQQQQQRRSRQRQRASTTKTFEDNVVLSDTSFVIPEYEELANVVVVGNYDYSDRYDRVYDGHLNEEQQQQQSPSENLVAYSLPTREQMCGTSDRDWCSYYDTGSDVNSEPTYNYAFIGGANGPTTNGINNINSNNKNNNRVCRRNNVNSIINSISRDGYNSCQSITASDRSSSTSHLYATVAPDVINVNPLIARCRNFEYVPSSCVRPINNVTFPQQRTRNNYVFNTGPTNFSLFPPDECRWRKSNKDAANGQEKKSRDDNSKDDKVETRV